MHQAWIPRVEQSDMPHPLAAYLEPRVRRLGYLGEMFKVGANAPDVLLAFMQFTDALKAALPFDVGETVVLTVASSIQNRYEQNQHERLCVRNGMSPAWIREVEALAPGKSTLMTPAQCAAQAFALALIGSNGRASQDEFAALEGHFSPGEAVSIGFLVGRYISHALIANTLELQPPVPSIHEDGFTAPCQGDNP